MKNVLIIGASGGIAQIVTDLLLNDKTINLTLFARKTYRLKSNLTSKCTVIEGDAMDKEALKTAMRGQDIVYVNLAGNLERMTKNIVGVMQETGVTKIIAISSIGIYNTPLKSVLVPYRKLADVIEASGLDYTILRPEWFSNENEVDYETTLKGTPEKGSVISRKSLASLITEIIKTPEQFKQLNLGVNKPNS
ncbi:NAD(P)H-binding protein [Flavobacterium yafengii]|uniref:NAD(P)H-binding protein n=1 Tax=Flavobacterium yafengii TaxID=3041253 RepID=UPI0024A83195|nr:NAD(P)H-binding protein [Flavobacterium yafengii]MDI5897189.1 NAD(P)H-binding protein [Flavobacterium yafengii]MDI6046095.1 NAD(P)H-binding protein [Flavobacterium yafengii]